MIRRRDFLPLIGGAAAWPVVMRAQQSNPGRRIGIVMGLAEKDPGTILYVQEVNRGLQALGWIDGKNIEIAFRYAAGDPDRARSLAEDLIALQPDLIIAHTTPVVAAIQRLTRTIPVVFVSIPDPVANGFVASIPRPGGNMTGFTNYEFSMGAKWLEILKQIAPDTTRVLLMLSPDSGSYYVEYLRSIETVALLHAVQATLAPVRNADEIERVMASLGAQSGSGLIVLPSAPITANGQMIIDLALRWRLPVIYPFRQYAAQGGLISYGVNLPSLFRQATLYADRILKGERPADLPVQAPTKFELVINLKTAKALGLNVPPMLLALIDEVIE
jgi:putative ABC transport system substrate-binding protein